MPLAPYDKPLDEFSDCLDKKLDKDVPYTLYEVSQLCKRNEQTVESYVKTFVGELNERMQKKGKLVRSMRIKTCRELPGLIVDPPSGNGAGLGWVLGLLGVGFGLGVGLAFGWAVRTSKLPAFACYRCGVRLDLTGWNQLSLQCPRCGQVYMR